MNQAVALSVTKWIANPSIDYLLESYSVSGVVCTGDRRYLRSHL